MVVDGCIAVALVEHTCTTHRHAPGCPCESRIARLVRRLLGR